MPKTYVISRTGEYMQVRVVLDDGRHYDQTVIAAEHLRDTVLETFLQGYADDYAAGVAALDAIALEQAQEQVQPTE